MDFFKPPSKKELTEARMKRRLNTVVEEEKQKKHKSERVPLQSYFQLLPKNILEGVRECVRYDSVLSVLDFTQHLSDLDGKKQSSLGYSAMFKNEVFRVALCFPSKRSPFTHAAIMKEYCDLEEEEAKIEQKPEDRPRPPHVITGKYLVAGSKKALIKHAYEIAADDICRFCGRSMNTENIVRAIPMRWRTLMFSNKPGGYYCNDSGPAHSKCMITRLSRLVTWEWARPERPCSAGCDVHQVSKPVCISVDANSSVIMLLKTVINDGLTSWIDPEEYLKVSEQLQFCFRWWSGSLRERIQKEKELLVESYADDERALANFRAMLLTDRHEGVLDRFRDSSASEVEKRKNAIEAFFKFHKYRVANADSWCEKIGLKVPDMRMSDYFRYTKDAIRYARLEDVAGRFSTENQLASKPTAFAAIADELFVRDSNKRTKPRSEDELLKFLGGLVHACLLVEFDRVSGSDPHFKDYEFNDLIGIAGRYAKNSIPIE